MGFTTGQFIAFVRRTITDALNRQNSAVNVRSVFERIGLDYFNKESDTLPVGSVSGLPDALAGKADLVGGKVPASQLPSYVDDVVEANTSALLPQPGESSKLYNVTQDPIPSNNGLYRWSGTAYAKLPTGGGPFEYVGDPANVNISAGPLGAGNTFAAGQVFAQNTFGTNVRNNAFQGFTVGNFFGTDTVQNTYGASFVGNRFLGASNLNTFAAGANGNTFGANYTQNTTGTNFAQNEVGASVSRCVFGAGVRNCTIGDGCNRVRVGNNCLRVTLINCFGTETGGVITYFEVPAGSTDVTYRNNVLVALEPRVTALEAAQLAAYYEEITHANLLARYMTASTGGAGLTPSKWYLVTERIGDNILAQFRRSNDPAGTAFFEGSLDVQYSYFLEDDVLSVSGGPIFVYVGAYQPGTPLLTGAAYFLNGSLWRFIGGNGTTAPPVPDFADAASWTLAVGGGAGGVSAADAYQGTWNPNTGFTQAGNFLNENIPRPRGQYFRVSENNAAASGVCSGMAEPSELVPLDSLAGFGIGMQVSGAGMPAGVRVIDLEDGQLNLSEAVQIAAGTVLTGTVLFAGYTDFAAGQYVWSDGQNWELRELRPGNVIGSPLPVPTPADNGKVMTVVNGAYALVAPSGGTAPTGPPSGFAGAVAPGDGTYMDVNFGDPGLTLTGPWLNDGGAKYLAGGSTGMAELIFYGKQVEVYGTKFGSGGPAEAYYDNVRRATVSTNQANAEVNVLLYAFALGASEGVHTADVRRNGEANTFIISHFRIR